MSSEPPWFTKNTMTVVCKNCKEILEDHFDQQCLFLSEIFTPLVCHHGNLIYLVENDHYSCGCVANTSQLHDTACTFDELDRLCK